MKVVHVGLGVRGHHWLEIIDRSADDESVAIVEPRDQACSGRAAALSRFDEIGQAVHATGADTAIIAAPIPQHSDLALACIENGLAVLVEKPLAASLADASRLVHEAARHGRPIVAAQNQRFCRIETTLRRLVQEGVAGEIRMVRCAARRHRPADGGVLAELDHPQLLEDAVHHFDTLRAILDSNPVRISARAFNPAGSSYRSGAATHALIEMEGGMHVQYSGSLASPRYGYTWWIEGDGGVLWSDRKRIFWRKRGSRLFRPMRADRLPAGDGAAYPFEGTGSLLQGLREAHAGAGAETEGADNLQTLAMVEAAVRSDQQGREIGVADLLTEAGAP